MGHVPERTTRLRLCGVTWLALMMVGFHHLRLLATTSSSSPRPSHHHQSPFWDGTFSLPPTTAGDAQQLQNQQPKDDEDATISKSDNNNPDVCQPRGIHLAQGSNVHPTTHRLNVTVSFRLNYQKCGPFQAIPQVWYGTGRGPALPGKGHHRRGMVVAPLQFNYTSNATNTVDYHSDWIYHVTLTHLKAGVQRYWYKIRVLVHAKETKNLRGRIPSRRSRAPLTRRTTTVVVETPEYSVWTPPKPGQPTTLALVGDLGQTVNSSKTVHHIYKATPNYHNPHNHRLVTQVLIAGDMSYADSDPQRWPSFFDRHEPLFRSTLLQVAVGNHEIECDTTTHLPFQPYEHYFRNPNRLGAARIEPISFDYQRTLWNHSCSAPSVFQGHYNYGNAFYTYVHGLARIVVLASYADTAVGSPQYEFLQTTLEQSQHERSTTTPWLIVSFHNPFYTTFKGHVNETQTVQMKAVVEDLLFQYQVNFVISGHDHAYLRTLPLYEGRVVDGAPIYLTLGAGGNREQHSDGYQHDEPEPWVAKRDISDYGYGHLHLPNATHAKFVWVRDGTTDLGILDEVWLPNQYSNDNVFSPSAMAA